MSAADEAIVTEDARNERSIGSAGHSVCGYGPCTQIIVQLPGHRRREYCCDAHRQAALRLRKRQGNAQEHQERSANVGYFLEKIHTPRLRSILEDILQSQGEVALLRLIVAIIEEREQAQASDEMQQRVAHLEIRLAEYRKTVDLQDRDKICQQFLAIGQLLGYRRLDAFHIGEGVERWKDYQSWTHELTLADVILYGQELADQEAAVKERSKLCQTERQLAAAQAEIQALREQVQTLTAGQAEQKDLEEEHAKYVALLADYMQLSKKMANLERQVRRFEQMGILRSRESMFQELMILGGRLKYAALVELGIAEGIDQWLAYIREAPDHELVMAIAHGYYQADSLAMAVIEASDAKLQLRRQDRIRELESDLARRDERIAELEQPQLLDLESMSELPALLYRLQEQNVALERLQNRIAELEDEARYRTTAYHRREESHGSTMYQMNILLARAQSEIQPLRRELDRYLPPPRAMLECALRRWSTRAKLPYDELKEDKIDTFLRVASERQLLQLIEWSEACYFIGKHRRRRIRIIQEHLHQQEPYAGDPALSLVDMDDQGHAIFANGDRRWQDTDSIERFWARIVLAKGQQTVGGNASVAMLQQYLYDHPGEFILVRQGNREYQIVVIDDDSLGITNKERLVRLYEDDIEQARRWINRDTESASRLEPVV